MRFETWFKESGGRFTKGEKRELKFFSREAFNAGRVKGATFHCFIAKNDAIAKLCDSALAAIQAHLQDAFNAGAS